MSQYQEHEGYQEQFTYNNTEHPYAAYSEHVQHQTPVFAPPFSTSFYYNPISLWSSLVAMASYLCLWPGGLIVLLFERNNRFVRFHAMQSLLFFGGVSVIYIAFFNIMAQSRLWSAWHWHWFIGLTLLAFLMVNIIAFIAWLVGIVSALRGSCTKLPFVGDIAERYVNIERSE